MRKVVTFLQGGLGNQMFIYAAGRAYALENNLEYAVNTGKFHDDVIYKRKMGLSPFCCVCSEEEYGWIKRKLMSLFLRYIKPSVQRFLGFYSESKNLSYQPIPRLRTRNVTLNGFWQSEKYFDACADKILEEFELKDMSWLDADSMAKEIASADNSIFMHIRSYMEAPSMKDGSGALPISYFENALKYLEERLSEGHVFVFSDNLAWAKDKFSKMESPKFSFTYVEPVESDKVSSQIRDFTLMRLCRHGIVANSSFSWWAGWLGERKRQNDGDAPIRIRPNRFVNNECFWPDRWVAIDE